MEAELIQFVYGSYAGVEKRKNITRIPRFVPEALTNRQHELYDKEVGKENKNHTLCFAKLCLRGLLDMPVEISSRWLRVSGAQ